MVFGNNHGRKTEAVKRQILSYLWNRNLAVGDRLPSQAEMISRFNVGTVTVNRAVQSLIAEGVLEARPRVGIFVRNPRPAGHMAQAVGIVGQLQDRLNLFNWLCSRYLQAFLRRNGCSCTEFPLAGRGIGLKNANREDFPGLQESLQQNLLDGIIALHNLSDPTLAELETEGIPVCFLGSSTNAHCGIVIDIPAFIEAAVGDLLRHGCKRPAVIIGALFDEEEERIAELLDRVFHGRSHPGWGRRERLRILADADGAGLAGEILAASPGQRPDGLVMCDDFIGQHFFTRLVLRQQPQLRYWPPCVNLVNLQSVLSFPCLELQRYQVDIEEMAERVGTLMLRRLGHFSDGADDLSCYRPRPLPPPERR